MPCQHGDEAEGETAEEVEHHVGILLLLQQRGTFVHESGKGGEAATEARGEQEFGGGRHQSVAVPVESRQEANEEASQHIHRQGAEGEGDERARLHHLRHPVPQATSEEAANTDQ